MPETLVVTGGSGFIGRRLLLVLARRDDAVVRVMARNPQSFGEAGPSGGVVRGDLREPAEFARALEIGCTWINIAHLDLSSDSEHVEIMSSLLEVCRKQKVRRLIHCSSAVVAGRSRESVITEDTPCQPGNRYEATKFAIERCLLEKGTDFMEVTVLRPTAVFGPRGRNLVKLASDLEHRPMLFNYLKSSLQGLRCMNLVHVDNVVAALAFLLDATGGVAGETFIISDDESPLNNYREVERRLMTGLRIPYYPIAPVCAPRWMLSAALRLAGRTNINPDRVYDCSKIIGRGLKKPVPFEQGLVDFLTWYRTRQPAQAA